MGITVLDLMKHAAIATSDGFITNCPPPMGHQHEVGLTLSPIKRMSPKTPVSPMCQSLKLLSDSMTEPPLRRAHALRSCQWPGSSNRRKPQRCQRR